MNNLLFTKAKPLLEQLEANGYEAYFVGGSVRDYLMHKDIHDIDITTSATPDEVEALFDKTIPIGKEHGTVNVVMQGENYEITTFRTEGEYRDHRRPDEVYFVRDLYEDVKRRDFTINSIAMDKDFNIIDYFNGYQDITEQRIRAVGNADERFREDALRILRGLRFQAQLNFEIDRSTREGMAENITSLNHLSVERIVVELKKLFKGIQAKKAFYYMLELNAFKYIPFFKNFNIARITIEEPLEFKEFIAILIAQQSYLGKLTELKLSNREKKEIETMQTLIFLLPRVQSKDKLRQCIYDYGAEAIQQILELIPTLQSNHLAIPSPFIVNNHTVDEIARNLPIRERKDLMISGKDLLEHTGRKGGKWVKEVLREIELAVLNQRVENQRTSILEWMDTHVEI